MPQVRIGAAIGQAYRYPTASELFQTTTVGTGANAISVNGNPNLKPEDALASELSGEYFVDKGRLRVSLFQERIKNAIFSQVRIYHESHHQCNVSINLYIKCWGNRYLWR